LEAPASYVNLFLPGESDNQMIAEKQKVDCSGVEKLLYLSKRSKPDTQNITSEIS
jgi:hypothetical protein